MREKGNGVMEQWSDGKEKFTTQRLRVRNFELRRQTGQTLISSHLTPSLSPPGERGALYAKGDVRAEVA
jgi:hypothetical protein